MPSARWASTVCAERVALPGPHRQERAALDVSRVAAGDLPELLEDAERVENHPGGRLRRVELAHDPHGAARAARRQESPLEHQDVAHALLREVEGDRAARHPAPDDHHVGGPRHGGPPLDHPGDRRLHDRLAPLVGDPVAEGDHAPVGLLRLPPVDDLDLDRDRVARQHRRQHPDVVGQEGQARPVQDARLERQALGEREGEHPGRDPRAEHALPPDVLQVHEERLREARQRHELEDLEVGDGPPERPVARPDGELLEVDRPAGHGCATSRRGRSCARRPTGGAPSRCPRARCGPSG